MSGQKIIDGLNDAIAFVRGDVSRGRLFEVQPDGKRVDVTARFMRDRGHRLPRPSVITRAPREEAAGGREPVDDRAVP